MSELHWPIDERLKSQVDMPCFYLTKIIPEFRLKQELYLNLLTRQKKNVGQNYHHQHQEHHQSHNHYHHHHHIIISSEPLSRTAMATTS